MANGAWKHPPKRTIYIESQTSKWITATIIFIMLMFLINFTEKAIGQAAFDAVYFDEFQG